MREVHNYLLNLTVAKRGKQNSEAQMSWYNVNLVIQMKNSADGAVYTDMYPKLCFASLLNDCGNAL